jgi:hypothetical protein
VGTRTQRTVPERIDKVGVEEHSRQPHFPSNGESHPLHVGADHTLASGERHLGQRAAHAAKMAPLSSYDCRNTCYAIADWTPITALGAVTEGQSSLYIGSLNCPPARCGTTTYHIGNALWLIDNNTEGPSCRFGLCWVEVGDVSFPYTTSITDYDYYWAANDPSQGYRIDYGDSITSDIGEFSNLSITNTGGNSWSIFASSYTYGTGVSKSLTNVLVVDHVEIGLELYDYTTGANPASAGNSHFLKTGWTQGGSFGYVPNQGNDTVNAPAYGHWQVAPAPGNQGGNWLTSCGC